MNNTLFAQMNFPLSSMTFAKCTDYINNSDSKIKQAKSYRRHNVGNQYVNVH